MAITSRNVSKNAAIGKETIQLSVGTSAVSQTGKRTAAWTAPYAFQVVSVEGYGLVVTTTMTYDVQIGSTSVLSAQITPTSDALVAGALSSTVANTHGAAGSVLSLKYTSGAAGAVTNGVVNVVVRPYGMKGDPTPMTGESA